MSVCDHTSVSIVVRRGDTILLIERARVPFGFALPAGHNDGDTYEDAAIRELQEEVGLTVTDLKLLVEGRKENPCRREQGTWHYWKLYEATVSGDVMGSADETKQVRWCTISEISALAARTKIYIEGGIPDAEWEKSPGLEPVMYEWFNELGLLI